MLGKPANKDSSTLIAELSIFKNDDWITQIGMLNEVYPFFSNLKDVDGRLPLFCATFTNVFQNDSWIERMGRSPQN